ncbi:60S ribosomal protein L18a-like protein [Mercurialis annua]|uniref:60S ribosomal protein L18a-like protein n=1 Tax=Mercurialis annua TaxID=3986 RepID=UPI00215F0F25|nr:60S ribosomal protein L18a-like protein [Mercurialis annua]
MTEEGKNRGVTGNPQSPYYGTFQGVANYYPSVPPPPPHPVVGFPQPVPPHGTNPNHPPYYYGYNNNIIPTGYAVIEARPFIERRLQCCGLGMGWFLFILGFIFGGIPWYIGTFILLFVQVDYREKPGYVACAIGSILAIIAVTLGATKGAHAW